MKRTGIGGLCLVSVLACTGFVASSAQAGQLGTCVKAQKVGKENTGQYTNKRCSTYPTLSEFEGGKTNKWEWEANAGQIPFVSESGESVLESKGGDIFGCGHSMVTGTFEGATGEKNNELTFTGCRNKPFELTCQSYGAAAGEIKTYELVTQFLDQGETGLGGESPPPGDVWVQESPAGNNTDPVFGPGRWFASFECAGSPYALSGSVSGVVETAYVAAKLKAGREGRNGKLGKATFKEAFADEIGEQELSATFLDPDNDDQVETAPSLMESTNEVIIDPLPTGLEIDSLAAPVKSRVECAQLNTEIVGARKDKNGLRLAALESEYIAECR